jgi:hypothetical protein
VDNVAVVRTARAPEGVAGPAERAAALAVVLEVLGLVRAQRRRARDRRRLVFASADDGARWVCVLDSDGVLGDRRMTRNVARFAWCSSGRWPAGVLKLSSDWPSLSMRAGADVLMLRYGPAGHATTCAEVSR